MNMSHVISHFSFGRTVAPRVLHDVTRLIPHLGRHHDRLNGREFINHRDVGTNITVSFWLQSTPVYYRNLLGKLSGKKLVLWFIMKFPKLLNTSFWVGTWQWCCPRYLILRLESLSIVAGLGLVNQLTSDLLLKLYSVISFPVFFFFHSSCRSRLGLIWNQHLYTAEPESYKEVVIYSFSFDALHHSHLKLL